MTPPAPAVAVSPPTHPRAGRALFAAAVLLYLGLCALTWDQIEEDAFIYYRVAANLGAGEGFTFNPGEPPVECSSSVWFQLLLVPVVMLPGGPVVPAKLLGIALGLLVLWLTARLALRLTGDRLLAGLAPWILACLLPFTLWSHRGLETPLYEALLLLVPLWALHPRRGRWWFVPVFLLVPARPEGFVVAGAAVLLVALVRRDRRDLVRGVAALFLLCLGFLACRVAYFHDLVPNPFYTKYQGGESNGWTALRTVVVAGDLWLLLVPAALAALRPRRWSAAEGMVLGLLAVTTCWAGMGEDWKPYDRHLAPALPFLAVTIALCLRGWSGPVWRRAGVAGFAALSVFVLLHGRAVYNFSRTWDNPVRTRAFAGPPTFWPERTPASDRIFVNSQATVGRFLHDNYPEGVSVLYDQMGQTPWYAGRDKTFLDTLGLVNRTVGISGFLDRHRDGLLGLYGRWSRALLGRLWPDERFDLDRRAVVEHLLDQEPDLILLHVALLRDRTSLQSRLQRHPRVQQDYRRRWLLNGSVVVWERRGVQCRTPPVVPEYATLAAP